MFCPPLPEHSGHQPPRQPPRALCYRRMVQPGAQKLVGQPEDCEDPLGAPVVTREAAIPVKIGRQSLQGDGDVTEPERSPGAVPPQVQTQEAEVVLRTQAPNFGVTGPNELR